MAKNTLIAALLLVGAFAASAQTNHLKLYLGFELAQRSTFKYDQPSQSTFLYEAAYATHPFYALAFSREKADGSFWEISGQTNAYFGYKPVFERLDTLVFPSPEIGRERNNYAQLQFEYNWLLGTDLSQKVRPYVGIFLRAAGQWAAFRPSTSAYFPQEVWAVGLVPGFVPRLQIQTGTRWRLDLSTPIVLGYFNVENRRNGDPIFSSDQQRITNLEIGMLNLDPQIRLGFSYALSPPPNQ